MTIYCQIYKNLANFVRALIITVLSYPVQNHLLRLHHYERSLDEQL